MGTPKTCCSPESGRAFPMLHTAPDGKDEQIMSHQDHFSSGRDHSPSGKDLLSRREFNGSCLVMLAGMAGFSMGASTGPVFGSNLLLASAPEMPKRKFGNTGLRISALSFGTGELDKSGWEPLGRALEMGVNFIDTSPSYERSEEILGENLLNSRERVTLSTKWITDGAASTENLIASFERSRKRLKTHYIDIIILENVTKVAQLNCVGSRQAFSELKKDKRVKFIGFETHTNQIELLKEARKIGGFDMIMVSYNIFNFKDLAPIIEATGRRGVGVLATEVVEGSIKEPNLAKRIFGRRGRSIAASSIGWALDDRWVSSVVVSPKSVEELEDFVKATDEEAGIQGSMKLT